MLDSPASRRAGAIGRELQVILKMPTNNVVDEAGGSSEAVMLVYFR